ncbi:hypothetical protein Q5762_07435 [Streptomyces sp. P9(2023)]|uniref:hypothetical protein n=1 Tax=Streptomyces sp. P9(2023) TaxID=3064394 RepID=UPI0028F42065|nr:hypothetical protein [Streptomyces sp. P9(2023)]MDT9688189.1 hypothetical protein [Streptomyces sp. P9(2023)]
MPHPFQHPYATHPAGTVVGYRRNGQPIYVIAGGSDEGAAGSASGQPPAGSPDPSGQPPTPPVPPAGDQGGQTSGGSGEETDWKALARQWEKRAKENKGAVDELAQIREQNMSDQEKAVAAAEKAGRTAAASEYAAKLAGAEFRAALAAARIELGEASALIDVTQFVDNGEVDTKAIEAAVKKLAKLAPRGPGRSGGDMGGSGGSGDQPSIDKQIAEATARRDFATVIRLKRQKAAT